MSGTFKRLGHGVRGGIAFNVPAVLGAEREQAWPGNINTTRALEATYFYESTETVSIFGVDIPRVLNDGYLYVEGARTNGVTVAPDVYVGGANATLFANVALAPDGTLSADRRQAFGALGRIYTNANVTNTLDYACSYFVKHVFGDRENYIGTSSSLTAVDTSFTAQDEWQRIELDSTANATGVGALRCIEDGPSNNATVDVWGWQVEEGSFASQLIRGAGTTRPADDVVIPRDNVPIEMLVGDWRFSIRPARGSADAQDGSSEVLFWLDANNFIEITASNSVRVVAGGVAAVESSALTWDAGQKIDIYVSAQDRTLTIVGATSGNGTANGSSWTWPSIDVQVGNDGPLANPFFGAISPVVVTTLAPPSYNLIAYWDAHRITENAGAVEAVADQSTNGIELSNGVAAGRPLDANDDALGAVMLFDGVDDALGAASIPYNFGNSYTLYFVVDFASLTDDQRLIDIDEPGGIRFIVQVIATGEIRIADGLAAYGTSHVLNTPGVHVITVVADGSNARATVFVDRVQVASVATSAHSEFTGTITLGNLAAGSLSTNGGIAGALAYQGVQLPPLREAVWDYIGKRWRVTIPALGVDDPAFMLEAEAPYLVDDGAGDVSEWRDARGGISATQVTAAQRPEIFDDPTYGKVLRFDGTTKYLDLSGFTSSAESYTFYVVYRATALAGSDTIFDAQTGRLSLFLSSLSGGSHRFVDNGGAKPIGLISDALQMNCYTTVFDAATQIATGYVNFGEDVQSGAYVPCSLGGIVLIGANFLFGNVLHGDLKSIIMFEEAHDATKRARVWDYIKNKWGL